jgi:murein DD-endopeptidase MepM/ murein hydrolase activator NlpD
MEFQIILLPKENYWDWVRASQDYVLTFGSNLTADPFTAGNYMAPRQVITFPKLPAGDPVLGDLEEYFQAKFPGVILDPIEAAKPSQLQTEFAMRIDDDDQFAQKRRPFYLLWPTNYAVITQKFGANPQIYSRFGVPAHEGLDIRALPNTYIYACADGQVYRVHTNPDSHPYGIHVRIRHRFGYKTVYGHLAQPWVEVGQQVKAGQVIGLADTTGATVASHLHLTLKLTGATKRGETNYPKDIIDPTPFMVWPNTKSAKSIPSHDWEAGKCLYGLHGRVDGPLTPEDIALIQGSRLEAIKLDRSESDQTAALLRRHNPDLLLVVRLSDDFSSKPVDAGKFAAQVEADVKRFTRAGISDFELLSNPNLQNEGWGRSWRDGFDFGRWWLEVYDRLRSVCPEARFGFPGLSPGEAVRGWRAEALSFLDQAQDAVAAADWLGVNCVWSDRATMGSLTGGRMHDEIRLRFPGKLLYITEFYNASANDSLSEKAEEYHQFYQMIRGQAGIGAAFAYALSAGTGHETLVWRKEGEEGSEILEAVGQGLR